MQTNWKIFYTFQITQRSAIHCWDSSSLSFFSSYYKRFCTHYVIEWMRKRFTSNSHYKKQRATSRQNSANFVVEALCRNHNSFEINGTQLSMGCSSRKNTLDVKWKWHLTTAIKGFFYGSLGHAFLWFIWILWKFSNIAHIASINSGRLKVVPVHPLACRSNKKEYNIKETGSSSSEIHIT